MRSTRPDGIDGVGHQPGGDGDGPAEQEGEGHAGISPEHQRLQSIVESKVHTSVDEDSNAGDDKSSVQTGNTVGSDGFLVTID